MNCFCDIILRCSRVPASVWRQAGWRGVLLRFVILVAIFGAVSIWSVWPMPENMASQIPTSQEGIATVPLFNAWTIAWNAHCAGRGMSGYWDAPIFHPLKGTFAFSEPQPATLVVAPAIWWLRSPAIAYNVYMLLSLTLNGLFAVNLMRTLRVGWIGSVVAGVAMIQHPLMHLQIDVVQLMPVWGILWTLASLIRLREAAVCIPSNSSIAPLGNTSQPDSRIRRSVILSGTETGLAFVSVFAVSVHHGLFLSLLLAATGWLIVPWRHFLQWLPGAVPALLIAAGLLLPLLFPVARAMREHAFERSETLVAQLSIKPIDYLVEPDTALIKCHIVAREGRWQMSPGWTRVLLALIAVCGSILPKYRRRSVMEFGFREGEAPAEPTTDGETHGSAGASPSQFHNRTRRHLYRTPSVEVWFLLFLAIVAFLLSLGANLQVGNWNIWTTLSQYVPGVSQVRSAFRFAYFVQIVVIVLAARGLERLWDFFRYQRRARTLSRWIPGVVFVTLGSLTMFEIPPSTVQLVGVPRTLTSEWKSFVKSNLKDSNGVLLLPYVKGTTVRDFDVTARWMLSTVLDDIPMINGYSGFFPESHFRLQKAIAADPYSDETLRLLYDAKIQFVILQGAAADKIPPDATLQFTLQIAGMGETGGLRVLEIRLRAH